MLRIVLCMLVGLALVGWGGSLWAQTPGGAAPASGPAPGAGTVSSGGPAPGSPASPAPAGHSFWDILAASGLVGLVIGLLSIAAVALVIEHAMTIRASVLMPPGLADDVRHLLAGGEVATARRRCQEQPSLLAFVLAAAMGEAESGWSAVEKAAEDAAADQSARLFRKIEYLSVIANLAPMLGLLGTVIGMVYAFREVATTQGAARAADLAEGIYLALVTTVEGLVVAIPALAAFAIFRNRVDQFVAEASYVAQHALAPLKRRRSATPGKAPTAPPAVGGSS